MASAKPMPASSKEIKTSEKTVSRQEIDTCVKVIADLLQNDPKKAAKIFEGWLDTPSKMKKIPKAA
jgi:hypothetical protein